MGVATVWLSEPLGPLTLTVCPSMATSTPPGTAIGSRPIRDIFAAPLPDVGEDFPTHALLVRLLVGEQPGGGGDDRHAQTAEHLGQGGGLRVDPQDGLGHPAHTGDAALAVGAVLQVDRQLLEGAAVLLDVADVPAGDVPLLLEDLGDLRLQLRRRHDRCVVICLVGVAQTGEHVCDRVGHRHGVWCLSRRGSSCAGSRRLGAGPIGDRWCSVGEVLERPRCRVPRRACEAWGAAGSFTSWTCARRGAPPRGPSPAGRSGTGRTCGRQRADGRTAGNGCTRERRTWACGSPSRSEPSWPWWLSPTGSAGGGHDGLTGEREAELAEQLAALVVVGGGGDQRDVHAARTVDPVDVDLAEHRLLRQAERVV